MNASDPLTPALRDRALGRLGFSSPPPLTATGLAALYAAWCAKVPFDNVRKMIALRSGGPAELPGMGVTDFLESWLAHGAGGTCWPTSNALFELVSGVGFDARRVRGAMRDLGVSNHGSVKVRIDGREWLVDSSMLTNVPLPLGEGVFSTGDAVFAAEVERVEGTHLIWFDMPPNTGLLPCRFGDDPATHALFGEGYEASRGRSPFNQRLYARRNLPGELLVLWGNTRFSKTAAGLTSRALSAAELRGALAAEIGLSEELIERWARCGALGASFEPPAGPPPPPITGMPPSRRPGADP